MSESDSLRDELTKRGVEYEVDDGKTVMVTRWKAYGEWVSFIEYDTGETRFCTDMRRFTPAQVIAATLGAVKLEKAKAKRMPNMWGFSSYYCGCCGHKLAEVANGLNEHFPNYFESCGTKAVYE